MAFQVAQVFLGSPYNAALVHQNPAAFRGPKRLLATRGSSVLFHPSMHIFTLVLNGLVKNYTDVPEPMLL